MARRRDPADVLTDAGNAEVLGTLTRAGWAKLAIAEAKSDFLGLDVDNMDDDDPRFLQASGDLLRRARRTSGSIEGAHRGDLRDALLGRRGRGTLVSLESGGEDAAEPRQR